MANDPQEAKRRFDDVYRSLLVIGPILSFAFSNYSLSQDVSTFIYYIGFPALITAVILWALSDLMNKSWEYHAKFIGYVFIWFACSSLFSIVYFGGGGLSGYIWYLAGIAVTAIVTYITGQIFVKNNIVSQKYSILMVLLPIILGLVSLIIL